MFVVDFCTPNGMRVDKAPDFALYDIGFYGDEKGEEVNRQGLEQGTPAKVDLYVINASSMCEIWCQQKKVLSISFQYSCNVQEIYLMLTLANGSGKQSSTSHKVFFSFLKTIYSCNCLWQG
jgi:hypothetical protein